MNRPTLVLIPGLMCDQAVWAAQIEALRAHGIEPAIARHGLADSIAAMARAVIAAHAGPLALVGHSMGGRVALEVVRQAGQRVLGVALLDTGFRPLAAGEVGARERQGRMQLLDQARREGIRAMTLNWIRGMLAPARLQDAALVEAIVTMFERRSVAEFEAQLCALLERPDGGAVLPSIAVPTLLLCGELDQWSPPAQHREMQQLIPGSLLTLVPDCGHMSPMERPAAVNAALLSWLERVKWGGGNA